MNRKEWEGAYNNGSAIKNMIGRQEEYRSL